LLTGDLVTLRPIERADGPRLVAWRNEPYVMRGLFSYRPLALAEHEQWFEGYLTRDDEILFVIETTDGTAIGTIGLSNIDFRNRKAELGRMLIGDQSYLGRGYAKAATLLLLDYAFRELNLHRLYLEVLADNHAAVSLYRCCHFEVEGRCRDAYFGDGRFQDVLVMGILEAALHGPGETGASAANEE
jgi:diamine N-acetyltransferase